MSVEVPKKLTRVSFLGVSNLAPQKAAELSASLQRIVTAIAEAHNSCDDARLNVDAKFKQITRLAELRDVISRVTALASEEAAIASVALRPELEALALSIAQRAESLRKSFTVYEENHPQRGALANGIYQSLLHLAQETVDLLRSADRGTCAKLTAQVSAVRAAVLNVRNAKTLDEYQQATPQLHEAIAAADKRFQNRASLFDDVNFERKVNEIIKTMDLAASILLTSKQQSLITGTQIPIPVDELYESLRALDETAQCSPEFSVIMEVEYFDDKTGIDIAALLEACMRGDKESIVKKTRDLASTIQGLVQGGQQAALAMQSPEKEKVLRACEDANAAMLDMAKTSKLIIESHPSSTTRTQLAQQQAEAAQRLRKAAASIPPREPLVLVREKNRLAEVARVFMDDFSAIMGPLSSPVSQ